MKGADVVGIVSRRKTEAVRPTLAAKNTPDSVAQQLTQLFKTYSQGLENNDVKYLCLTSSGVGIVKHESRL